MEQNLKSKLELANKLIFVKAYDAAKDLLLEIISSDQGKDFLVVHLRLAELSVKLDSVDEYLLFYKELKQRECRLYLDEGHPEEECPYYFPSKVEVQQLHKNYFHSNCQKKWRPPSCIL